MSMQPSVSVPVDVTEKRELIVVEVSDIWKLEHKRDPVVRVNTS